MAEADQRVSESSAWTTYLDRFRPVVRGQGHHTQRPKRLALSNAENDRNSSDESTIQRGANGYVIDAIGVVVANPGQASTVDGSFEPRASMNDIVGSALLKRGGPRVPAL